MRSARGGWRFHFTGWILLRFLRSRTSIGVCCRCPRFRRDGEAVSPLDGLTCGLGVPVLQEDSERTGILLNAFFAASHAHMRQALMNNYVHFYLSDNDQALMLERIFDHVVRMRRCFTRRDIRISLLSRPTC